MKTPATSVLLLSLLLLLHHVQDSSSTGKIIKKLLKLKWGFMKAHPTPTCCQPPPCNVCQQAPVYRPSPKPVYRPPVCNVCQQQTYRPPPPPRPPPRPVCDPCARQRMQNNGGYGRYQGGGYGGGGGGGGTNVNVNVNTYGGRKRRAAGNQTSDDEHAFLDQATLINAAMTDWSSVVDIDSSL